MEIGREVRTLMSGEEIDAALTTIAKGIDTNVSDESLILVGIRRRGVPLAERLAAKLRVMERDVKVGMLDITLYRDDLSEIGPVPMVGKTEIPFNINGFPVVLVDDVLFTGRTIRAALDCLNDFGRPKKIQLAVLVDRGGRELPIAADYKSLTININASQHISVRVQEFEGEDSVVLMELDKNDITQED